MRLFNPAVLSFGLLACTSETTPKTFNANPDATITSHAAGAEILEGYAVEFRAQVSDSNHSPSELEVSWYVGTTLVCDWSTPTPAGETGCETALELGDENIVVEVRDPDGAGGRDEIALSVTPTASPAVFILSPAMGGSYYADQLILFKAAVNDAEDNAEDLVSVWESSIAGELTLNTTPDANGEIEDYGYLSEGEHAIKLHVTDLSGKTTTESLVINVSGDNSDPLCEINSPTPGSEFVVGESISFSGSATDDDINNSTLSISWESDLDGAFNTAAANTDGSLAFAYDGLSGGVHSIALKVEDEAGGYCQTSVQIAISSVPSFDTPATISPTPVYTNSTLTCSSNASDPDDGTLNPVYEWSVNGQTVASGSTYTVDANQTNVGDSLVCTATATDSDGQIATSTASATIENTLPTAATISLGPPTPAEAVDDLFCSIDIDATDIDNHPISYSIEWLHNGAPHAGPTTTTVYSGDTISASETIAGEMWSCLVTPNDGFGDGPTTQSNTLTIDFACANADAFITTQAEADSYIPCTELNSISIDNTSGILALNLPNLITVHSTIYISNNSDLFDVNLPALESVGSYVYFYHNYDIETVDFTALETVDGYFYIDTNTSIDSFSLPVLSYVDEYSYFSNNTLLCVPNLNWATISQDYHYDNGNLNCGSPVVFGYTGGVQTLTIPNNVYSITVEAYGAEGGDGWNQDSGGSVKGLGGLGGYASATIPVTPGETLEIYVGDAGQDAYSGYPGMGGFNGGGDGTTTYDYQGGGGGGASDVRRGSGYADRLIVAGGGGAGSGWCTAGTGNGGHGGGASGADGQMCTSYPVGTGGTQSSGGTFGSGFGYGGSATDFAGAGGGGGYYGGGASDGSGGGGGSSFVAAPGNTNQNMAGGVNPGPGEVVVSW